MAEITFVKIFVDYLDAIEPLGDAERGRLFTSLLTYARTGEVPQLGGNERFLFPMMKAQLDRDVAEYNAKIEQKSEAGKKGGRPKKAEEANAFSEKQKKLMLFSESEKSKEEDKDKEKDKEEDKDKDKSARTRDADAFAAFAAGDGDLLAILKDFEKMRKSIKKPMTPHAKELLVGKLKNNFPPEQWKPVLEQSIVKCWQDIYPLKEQEQQRLGVVAHSEKASAQQLESLKEIYRKVKGE